MNLEFDVIIWDGEDPDTIEHWTLQEAFSEDAIHVEGNKIMPADESVILRLKVPYLDYEGKEVYQGDIVESRFTDELGVIEYGEYIDISNEDTDQELTCIGFHIKNIPLGNGVDGKPWFIVKGNKWENPELILEEI